MADEPTVCEGLPETAEGLQELVGAHDEDDEIGEDEAWCEEPSPPVCIARSAAGAPPTSGQPQNTGTIAELPGPRVDPTVRLLTMYDPRWGRFSLREPKFQYPTPKLNAWAEHGCSATSLAMILRWWAEDNPETANELQFPFKGKVDPIDSPIEIMLRLHDSPYVPQTLNEKKEPVCHQRAIPRLALKVRNRATGENMRADWVEINQKKDQKGKTKPTNDEDKKKAIIQYLQLGPVAIHSAVPAAHWMVVQGYRDGIFYVCDSGNMLSRPKYWGKPVTEAERMPSRAMPPLDNQAAAYNGVPEKHKFKHGTWLSTINILVAYYFDENNKHPTWSK